MCSACAGGGGVGTLCWLRCVEVALAAVCGDPQLNTWETRTLSLSGRRCIELTREAEVWRLWRWAQAYWKKKGVTVKTLADLDKVTAYMVAKYGVDAKM